MQKSLWQKLDGIGKTAVFTISVMAILAAFAYFFIVDKSSHANTMHIELAAAKPGTQVLVFAYPQKTQKGIGRWFSGNTLAAQEVVIDTFLVRSDTLYYRESANQIWGNQPLKPNTKAEDYIVNRTFWLGTDTYGRDYASRLMLGARISLSVGFIAVLLSLLIGIPLGAIAGYYGGFVDKLLMWFINVVWSIPTLLMVISLTFVLGKGFWQVFVAVGLTMWVEVARVVRGQVLSIKQKEYVEAARVLGYTDFRILLRHILPNALSPVIVISAANFASAILIESGLSFLGIGAQPPMPSWGSMIRDHYAYIIMGNPFLAILPGLAIMIAVLAFMSLGNSLRDALDVKLKPTAS